MEKLNIHEEELTILKKVLSFFSLKNFKKIKKNDEESIKVDIYLYKYFLGSFFKDCLTGDIKEIDLNTSLGKSFSLLCLKYNLFGLYNSEYSSLYVNSNIKRKIITEQDLFQWISHLLICNLLEEKALKKQKNL